MRRLAILLLGSLAFFLPVTAGAKERAPAKVHTPSALDQAIERGVAYLLKSQNKNGSWGSPASNLHDIFAPIPGSQRTFQVASSALCLSALLEVGGEDPKVRAAVARATTYLLGNHAVRRIRANTLYNTWALIYSLETFARLLAREKNPHQRARLLKASELCVKNLERYEFVEGGWGYYNFKVKSKDPGQGSTTFTTAAGLVALGMASQQGVAVPKGLIKRAVAIQRKCGRPDGAYAYSYRTSWWPTNGINKTKGSLARTPACLKGFSIWGEEVDPARFTQALDELETYGHFLRIARKYPRPHETWYQNSGYFCFYGYYYAALLIEDAPKKKRPTYRKQIAGHLLKMQEKDGSWWDYQLFSYHKAYGTGYVLLSLAACRK